MDVTAGLGGLFPVLPTGVIAAGGFPLSELLLLIIAVAVLTSLMLSTRRRIQRSKSAKPAPARERWGKLSDRSRGTRGIDQAMLELDELSRQIHGRLDIKLARLEALIRDADARIERLATTSGRGEAKPTFEVTLGAEGGPVPPPGDAERHAEIHRLADRGLSVIEIAESVGKAPGVVELVLALRKTSDDRASNTSSLELSTTESSEN